MESVVTLDRKESAPVDKLRRWVGVGFSVDDDGTNLVITATDSRLIGRSADGQFLAMQTGDGAVAGVSTKTGARWSMQPWLKSWHSNVGGGPGLMVFEFPASGDAILIHCMADHGMMTVHSQRLADRATGRVRAETPTHMQQDASHAFSPDGTKLAVGFRIDWETKPVLQIFDTRTGQRTESALRGPLAWNTAGDLAGTSTPCGDGD
ncbi:MAG: hypothetical protein HOV80_38775 [Polyangiaceae bacterium]|nr:hypothetical protein [Polyangiaceae bacterium]